MHYYPPPEPFDQMPTPSTFVNGRYLPGVAGPLLSDVRRSYERLNEAVTPLLAEKTEIKITLSAEVKDGKIELAANAQGWHPANEKLRLRMALAENDIHFVASNQIRLHNMVVRHMPGGPDGIAPQDGKLEFSGAVDLAEFKQGLVDYLAVFEENTAQVFPEKPLDLQNLHFVAFVQDDATREVLQAAETAVEGKLEYPADIKPSVKPKNGGSRKPAGPALEAPAPPERPE
jgi:hypothetical protein